ncbi:phage tail sheath family protein [Bacteroides oleiciplenus]|uniref:Phage tail sheath family protein n=1 Tax=Bacteroides oleiciplenus TaxID=626931 RepID=A0A3E5B0Y0_9BACE|nr:phage tail sheath C-terminal domain-containing protein [Bacteroides oleiciplenus]RGN31247.1 phage tail sheath family protein [Bacteroides oleiciplenus]
MGEYKTPGVYIKEKNAFPNSVVEAETAIPTFIGLTEKAENGTESLLNKPVKISSMTEYNMYFGGAPIPKFMLSVETVAVNDGEKILSVCNKGKNAGLKAVRQGNLCTLYYNLVMFFANGGGTCYIVSVGDCNTGILDKNAIKNTVLPELKKVQDITMLVVPEAVNTSDCMNIYTDILAHCEEQNRFAIIDIPSPSDKAVDTFRSAIGGNHLSYAAAYYPWLETSVLSDNDINGEMLTWDYTLIPDLTSFVDRTNLKPEEDTPMEKYIKDSFFKIVNKKDSDKEDAKVLTEADIKLVKNDLHNALLQNWSEYKLLAKKVKDYLNLLPPSAAMAGIYTMVDSTRGVWKAPANVSVNYVNKPSVVIDNKAQEELNMPMNGKAVNAIRSFVGEGVKVWGARTLDGNSQDWRYINVRRTMSFLEHSVKNAARAYVFEPNDANTWINMKCMIENFLRSVWKRGGLAGATPEDAYSVHVGLGDTMTPEDILEGIMRITVLVAISRPAEFIEITFQQQMQKS